MIELSTNAAAIKTVSGSIDQSLFLNPGSTTLKTNAVFFALVFKIYGYNVSWTLANPTLTLWTGYPSFGNIAISPTVNGTDPVCALYPPDSINSSEISASGTILIEWIGNAGFIPGGLFNYVLYYSDRPVL